MATATKKERKEEAYHWKASASSGHTTTLKQSILRLSISMEVGDKSALIECNQEGILGSRMSTNSGQKS
jgi:hypothetical protein